MKKDYKKKKKTGVSKPQVSFAKMPKATISTFGKKPDLERDIINLTGVALPLITSYLSNGKLKVPPFKAY